MTQPLSFDDHLLAKITPQAEIYVADALARLMRLLDVHMARVADPVVKSALEGQLWLINHYSLTYAPDYPGHPYRQLAPRQEFVALPKLSAAPEGPSALDLRKEAQRQQRLSGQPVQAVIRPKILRTSQPVKRRYKTSGKITLRDRVLDYYATADLTLPNKDHAAQFGINVNHFCTLVSQARRAGDPRVDRQKPVKVKAPKLPREAKPPRVKSQREPKTRAPSPLVESILDTYAANTQLSNKAIADLVGGQPAYVSVVLSKARAKGDPRAMVFRRLPKNAPEGAVRLASTKTSRGEKKGRKIRPLTEAESHALDIYAANQTWSRAKVAREAYLTEKELNLLVLRAKRQDDPRAAVSRYKLRKTAKPLSALPQRQAVESTIRLRTDTILNKPQTKGKRAYA